MKDLTVCLDGSPDDDQRIAQAAAICRNFDAHLTGLYLNVLPTLVVPADGMTGAAGLSWDIQSEAIAAGDRAVPSLTERLSAAVPLSELRRQDVFAEKIWDAVATQGRVSDLVVTGRPYGDEAADTAVDIVEASLFGSGRGTLIAPPAAPLAERFGRILLGWANTSEAARAVSAAMPFLEAADLVTIAIVDRQGAPAEDGAEPAADIARHLNRHGIKVEVQHLSDWDRIGEGLIDQAVTTGADLIVAGAFGHSRLREWLLGGTSRELLTDSPVPLLMAH